MTNTKKFKIQEGKKERLKTSMKKFNVLYLFIFLSFICSFALISVTRVSADTARTLSDSLPTTDVNSTKTSGKGAFKLVVCDGPAELASKANHVISKPGEQPIVMDGDWMAGKYDPGKFVPCDFNGLMLQVQHLINIAMVLGVLAATAGLCYVGFLYIKGGEKNISDAKTIFPKLFWGFIIMLTAWFMVFQVLTWLTGNSTFTKLLGSP